MLIEDERLNRLTGSILGCAIEVHRVLGPGLLESVYAACLHHELSSHKHVPKLMDGVRRVINPLHEDLAINHGEIRASGARLR